MTKKLRTVEVDTCGSCPFLSQTGFSNSCGRMPYVMEKDGFPKYGVNDDGWPGPAKAAKGGKR